MLLDFLIAAAPTTDESTSWPDKASLLIATLALAVAVSTFILGLRNRSTAKRALALSERQEARRESVVDLHLYSPVSWRLADGNRLLGLNLLVMNPTDRDSSLISVELHLTYSVDGVLTTLKVPHSPSENPPDEPTLTALELPARLTAGAAVSGWALFHVSNALTGARPVDRYDVVVRDIHNIEKSRQVTVFQERLE